MADDRPIIVSGADHKVTVTLPNATKSTGGSHTLDALPASGPFKRIVFTNDETKRVEFSRPAAGDWTITIE